MTALITLLKSELGYTEGGDGYTKFGEWYNTVELDSDYSNQAWCDMFLSWGAHTLGYDAWFGQSAWTVGHAKWFRGQDAWGTKPEPGAVVFYDWSGSRSLDAIDHVGIVLSVDGGKIRTIEGNVDGRYVREKTRDLDKVVGYGYPEELLARQTVSLTIASPDASRSVSVIPSVPPPVALAMPQPAPSAKPSSGSVANATKPAAKAPGAEQPATIKKATASDSPPATPTQPRTQAGTQAGTQTLPEALTPAAAPGAAIAWLPAAATQPLAAPALGAQAIVTPLLIAALVLAFAKTRTRTPAQAALSPGFRPYGGATSRFGKSRKTTATSTAAAAPVTAASTRALPAISTAASTGALPAISVESVEEISTYVGRRRGAVAVHDDRPMSYAGRHGKRLTPKSASRRGRHRKNSFRRHHPSAPSQ